MAEYIQCTEGCFLLIFKIRSLIRSSSNRSINCLTVNSYIVFIYIHIHISLILLYQFTRVFSLPSPLVCLGVNKMKRKMELEFLILPIYPCNTKFHARLKLDRGPAGSCAIEFILLSSFIPICFCRSSFAFIQTWFLATIR